MICACAIFSSVGALLYSIFTHYLINSMIFQKKLLNIKCVFQVSQQLLSEIFFILRRTEQDMIENVQCLHLKYPLFLSNINEI